VCKPFDGNAATAGNGNMASIACESRAKVDALHAKAMELGGTDEGAPGVRGEEGDQAFYGAYFRDPDGNKLAAFCIGPAR
jgi:predicted lactoylglutathione lyase